MGVRNLKLHNESLLFKWLWRFNKSGDELWKDITTARYWRNGFWSPCTVTMPRKVGVWKHICKLLPEYQQYVKLVVGNGRKIKFWTDVLLEDGKLMEKFPFLYSFSISKQCTVAEPYTGHG